MTNPSFQGIKFESELNDVIQTVWSSKELNLRPWFEMLFKQRTRCNLNKGLPKGLKFEILVKQRLKFETLFEQRPLKFETLSKQETQI